MGNYNNKKNDYHQVGHFCTPFLEEYERISSILQQFGYGVCRTVNGDAMIMRPGDFSEDQYRRMVEEDDCIEIVGQDEADDDGDNPYNSNVTHFPREY